MTIENNILEVLVEGFVSLILQTGDILLSTLTSVASDLINYALRLDNELSARPPHGRHGL